MMRMVAPHCHTMFVCAPRLRGCLHGNIYCCLLQWYLIGSQRITNNVTGSVSVEAVTNSTSILVNFHIRYTSSLL